MACADENLAVALIEGRLSDEAAADVHAHVAKCDTCRQLLAQLVRSSARHSDTEAGSPLRRGGRVGRYLVLNVIGSGGMGVVYAAYDPELDRKVALKLLRQSDGASPDDARLYREAQATARLSHPNVVGVYDVGTIDDQVYVAMELIDGVTVTEWLNEKPRTWRSVLDVYCRAGRGLAAAHDADLVHRDFKPDNVLVGADGRVRVVDFGLARSLAPAANRPGPRLDPPTDISRSGAVHGTPRYMAPEQLTGQSVTTAADQFSFCVALYEALCARHPFPGKRFPELATAIVSGQPRRPPPESRVPSWLSRIVLRGLRRDPGERFESMAALLAELGRDRGRTRRRIAGAAAIAGLVVAAIVGATRLPESPAKLCSGAESRLAGVWDEARKRSLRQTFRATGVPYAQDALGRINRTLDDYARSWAKAHIEACEATRVRGEQSERLLDARMACLRRRHGELSVVVEQLGTVDATTAEHSTRALDGLGAVSECSDVDRLSDGRLEPDPRIASEVEVVQKELARADAIGDLGRYEAGLAAAKDALESASELDHLPLIAEAHLAIGLLQGLTREFAAAEVSFEAALFAAEASGHDSLAAMCWIHLISVVGVHQRRHAEASAWTRRATAAVMRAGGDQQPELEGELAARIGQLYIVQERYDEALEELRRAEAILSGPDDSDSRFAAGLMAWMGSLHSMKGDYPEAARYQGRSAQILERLFGPRHPEVAGALQRLGMLELRRGDAAAALPLVERALSIEETAWEPDSPRIATTLDTLGIVHLKLRESAKARPFLERALAIRTEAHGQRSLPVAKTLTNLSIAQKFAGALHDAETTLERALAIKETTVGPDSRELVPTLQGLGEVVELRGRLAEALVHYRRALAISERTVGPDHEGSLIAGVAIGRALVKRGSRERGLQLMERAVSSLEAIEVDPLELAQARFDLARALWPAKRRRAGALELARQARRTYAQGAARNELADVSKWLASRSRDRDDDDSTAIRSR